MIEADPDRDDLDEQEDVDDQDDLDERAQLVDEVLEEIGVAPMSTKAEQREAVVAALDLLQEEPQSRSDFVYSLHAEHTAGYENERTWWRRVLKPVLKEHPDVKTPAGGNPWKLR